MKRESEQRGLTVLLTHFTANELLRQNGYFAGVEDGSLGSPGIFEQLVLLSGVHQGWET